MPRARDLLPDRSSLTLRTLGAAYVTSTDDGAESAVLPITGKQLALLAYLACAPERSAQRSRLIALFWASTDEKRADNAFRDLLKQLRGKLGTDALGPARADPVRLVIPLESDRDALIAASRRREFRTVLQLYAGEFLARMELLDAPPAFAQWLEGERAHLRRLFLDAARESVSAPESTAAERVAIARQLNALHEADDVLWRSLIRSELARSDRAAATQVAELAKKTFADSEAELSSALLDVMREAGLDLRSSARARVDGLSRGVDATDGDRAAIFVGRTIETAIAIRAWERACGGRLSHLHMIADAGLGKSAFLSNLRRQLRSPHLREPARRTIEVRATQGTRDLPYAFAASIARALATKTGALEISQSAASALVALAPSLREHYRATRPIGAGTSEAHEEIASALKDLLAAVALDRPAALLLDDLHWSDSASIALLASAWKDGDDARALIVSAGRTPCEPWCTGSTAQTFTLEPFTVDEVRVLIEHTARLPDEPWAEQISVLLREATNGSPLLVQEQLKLLAERRLLRRSGARWVVRDSEALLAALDERGAPARRVERLAPDERLLLLLLSVSGIPLSTARLRSASGMHMGTLAALVGALLKRGLVTRSGRDWIPAHEEHAAAMREVAGPDAVRDASRQMGRSFAQDALDVPLDRPPYADDLRQLQQAAALLTAGEDHSTLDRVFGHFVRRARRAGDGRPNVGLAAEFLHSAPPVPTAYRGQDSLRGDLVSAIVHALPWRIRWQRQLRFVTRVSLMILMAAVAVGAIGRYVRSLVPDDAPLEILLAERHEPDGRTYSLFRLPIREANWQNGTSIDVSLSRRPDAQLQFPMTPIPRRARADGHAWLAEVGVPDSGVIDIFEVTDDDRARRWTFSPGDDLSPTWRPDGQGFVFSTARWNALAQYDLATFDTLTGDVRQLTSGDDRDVNAVWSPDGSSIAFLRQYWTGGSGICVVDADGGSLRCHGKYPGEASLHGWIGVGQVLFEMQDTLATGERRLMRWDLTSGRDEVVDPDFVSEEVLNLSPDGRWIVCLCTRRGVQPRTWMAFPVDGPRQFRTLHVDATDGRSLWFSWLPSSADEVYLKNLQVLAGPGSPVVGFPYRLRTSSTDALGRSIQPGVLRWRSLDTAIATIDSVGLLYPRRTGSVRVAASAGGWRRDTIALAVQPSHTQLLFQDEWSKGLTSDWIPFGDPRPRVAKDSVFGAAFLNNGDQYYFSGAYSSATYPVDRGLWIEAELSTPVKHPEQWQEQILTLFATNSATLRSWDHIHGDMDPGDCRIYFPGGEGTHHGDSIFVSGPRPGGKFRAPAWLRTGRPFRAIVQIFPDGRCGFALNDDLLWISPPAFNSASARVKIDGRSVGTRMAVGRVRVFSGIAPRVRWEKWKERE